MAQRETVVGRNVSLYPTDWQTIEAADLSGSGVSAALRLIVRQWKQYNLAERALAETAHQYAATLADASAKYTEEE